MFIVLIIVLVVFGALAFFVYGYIQTSLCPDVVGKPFNEAVKIIEDNGFKYKILYPYLKTHRKPEEDDKSFFGRLEIIKQSPAPETKVKPWKKLIVLYVTEKNSK